MAVTPLRTTQIKPDVHVDMRDYGRQPDQAVTDTLVSAGLGPYIVHGCGRSFGFETEIKFSEDNTRTLEADMIVSIEPSVYMDGFQARIESSLRITNGRPELLTPIHEGVIIA